jgi:hypothetical protein
MIVGCHQSIATGSSCLFGHDPSIKSKMLPLWATIAIGYGAMPGPRVISATTPVGHRLWIATTIRPAASIEIAMRTPRTSTGTRHPARYRHIAILLCFYIGSYKHTANEGLVRIQYKCLVPIYVFLEMKLLFPTQNYNVLSPGSYTRISVRDLYISRIKLPILLQGNMWTDPGSI